MIGERLVRLGVVDSTNDVAFRLAAAGDAEGTVVVAEGQTRGRGRQGRAWHSPPERNLYCSVILRPQRERREWPDLSWVIAGAVAAAIVDEDGSGIRIKYPNDVYAAGRKVAGILLETRSGAAAPEAVIAGIGVNVNGGLEDFPPDLADTATTLRLLRGAPVDRERFLEALCKKIEGYYRHWREGGPDAVRALLGAAGIDLWGNGAAHPRGALQEYNTNRVLNNPLHGQAARKGPDAGRANAEE